MAIEDLTRVVTPPQNPTYAGPASRWSEVQQALGIELPADFRDYGLTYGSGRFYEGFIAVDSPFGAEYVDERKRGWEWLKDVVEGDRSYSRGKYVAYPEKGGLFLWGSDENDGMLCWQTEGKPKDWPIVLRQHGSGYEEWNMSMTEFLAKALTNQIRPRMWIDEEFEKDRLDFTPRTIA